MIKKFRLMAEEFVERIKDCSEVVEVGIVGSVASGDRLAMDCDLALVMEGFSPPFRCPGCRPMKCF